MGYQLQRSFSAGEISPKVYLRNDGDFAELNKQCLAKARNIVPTPHGPGESRKGFQFIGELTGETSCRLFDLDISFGESYTVAVTENFIYILDRNGFTNGAELILNPDFGSGGDDWLSNQVVFALNAAAMDPLVGQASNLRQEITTVDPSSEHTIHTHGLFPDGDNPFTINIGTTPGGSEIDSFPSVGFNTSNVFIPGVGNEDFWISIDIPAGGDSKTIDAINCFPTVDAGDIVQFPSPYLLADLVGIQVDKEPGNKVMFFVHRRVTPHELRFEGNHIWSFEEVEFEFGEGMLAPWEQFYPGCITFYAGRMALGGTTEDHIGIWLSQPRNYRGFDLGDPEDQLPDNALYLPLDKHGELVWLKGNKQLFAGLDSGEHVVFGESGVIVQTNAATEQHSTYGSARIQAMVVNEEVAYVDTRGRKVRLIEFDSNQQNMTSFDISFVAEHITEGRISEMKYGSSPYGVLYMPTFLGNLITCWIEKDRGIYGWSKWETQGNVISTTVLREFGIDVLWIAVIRDGKLFIEREDVNTNIYTDSHLVMTELVPTDTFFGFDHLIGQVVQIVADGSVHPERMVAGDGSITLQLQALEVAVGLGFTPEMETIPENDDIDDGNTRTHTKRHSKVSVALLDSPRPIVNDQDTYRRDPATPMDTREASKTEIVEITNTGWDKDAVINVKQPLPINMVIAGIGGKLKSNKL